MFQTQNAQVRIYGEIKGTGRKEARWVDYTEKHISFDPEDWRQRNWTGLQSKHFDFEIATFTVEIE